MADNRNRKRPIQVKFFVDEKEQALIKKKMELAGIENMSAYIRKMVIDIFQRAGNNIVRATLFCHKMATVDDVQTQKGKHGLGGEIVGGIGLLW